MSHAGPPGALAFPASAAALIDRVGALHSLDGELAAARRVAVRIPAVPLESSVSLPAGAGRDLRLTLGIRRRPADPQGRAALMTALSGLGAERVAARVDKALALAAPVERGPGLVRSLALRACSGEPARPRPGARVGGRNCAERSARMAAAMRSLGLERAAGVHERLVGELAENPFSAVVPYGLGFDLGPDRALGAKTYFVCEWPDAVLACLGGRLADDLGLDGTGAFEVLAASAHADWRRVRGLLEVSFELPDDPAQGVRAKAYVPPRRLAPDEAAADRAVLRIASALGLDLEPYRELVHAVRPDGLGAGRPCSLMAGVSASRAGPSLELYVFDPGRVAEGGAEPAVPARLVPTGAAGC